jgi:hypothetical protein
LPSPSPSPSPAAPRRAQLQAMGDGGAVGPVVRRAPRLYQAGRW